MALLLTVMAMGTATRLAITDMHAQAACCGTTASNNLSMACSSMCRPRRQLLRDYLPRTPRFPRSNRHYSPCHRSRHLCSRPPNSRRVAGRPRRAILPHRGRRDFSPVPCRWCAAGRARSWRFARRRLPVPEPLVIYHPSMPEQPTRAKPWKRSRTVRIAMRMKHRRARWQRSQPNAKKIAVGILIAFCLLLVVSLSSGSAYAYGYYQSQLPRLQGLANQQTEQTTRIYDRNSVLLYEAYAAGGRSTPVTYKYIPQVMQDAMIAAEDHTFWTNSGIDPQGILRAATEY